MKGGGCSVGASRPLLGASIFTYGNALLVMSITKHLNPTRCLLRIQSELSPEVSASLSPGLPRPVPLAWDFLVRDAIQPEKRYPDERAGLPWESRAPRQQP